MYLFNYLCVIKYHNVLLNTVGCNGEENQTESTLNVISAPSVKVKLGKQESVGDK